MAPYKRKSERVLTTQDILDEAKRKIEAGDSKRKVARDLGIKESTLRKRLKAGTVPVSLGRFKNALSDEMEKELAQHCKDLDNRFYGLTRKHIMKVAFDFAEKNGVSERFNQEKKLAGKDWLKGFCKRHKLSVRAPELCSVARAVGFNKVQVSRFFENLKQCRLEKKFPPHRIFNMDETGVTTVPNKTPKIISPKGKKTVCKVSSAERGQTVTAVCSIGATGFYVPPALIFPRKRMNNMLYKDAPTGTLPLISDTGYMTTDLFIEWLKHFAMYVKPSLDDPVLLIADNHSTHCSLGAVLFCRENHITFLTLPPHGSHLTQPLDRVVFAPLKTAYATEAEKWLVQNPGKVITLYQVAGIFGAAYSATASVKLAERAFKATGIEPYDPDVISEDMFAPSLVTAQISNEEGLGLALHQPETMSTEVEKNCDSNNLNNDQENGNLLSSEPTTSGTIRIQIQSVLPLPQHKRQESKNKRPAQKSNIITSSPYKNILEEKEKAKQEIEKAKADRALLKTRHEAETKNANTKKVKSKNKLRANFETVQSQGPSTSHGEPSTEVTTCPACKESYDEDWIQCGICNDWWHEGCSSYEGYGPFVCDYC
ncbi:uncharacterized protein LOC134534428 [Bacillus rossius redtenbacheri]|uniref:uncharacterized protein LOC134530893 n=1 Tax=Bacillus rossius redtenbacheri TaxID=93214 RepID=UPI002FDDC325